MLAFGLVDDLEFPAALIVQGLLFAEGFDEPIITEAPGASEEVLDVVVVSAFFQPPPSHDVYVTPTVSEPKIIADLEQT